MKLSIVSCEITNRQRRNIIPLYDSLGLNDQRRSSALQPQVEYTTYHLVAVYIFQSTGLNTTLLLTFK